MMKIVRAAEIENDPKMQMGTIFVDGFYQWLRFFSKDKEKLQKAFQHMFNLDVFYVAVIDDAIAGIAACTNGVRSSVHLNKSEFRKHLGFFKGSIAYYILRKEFESDPYPFEIDKSIGSIEFVATSQDFRGRGVATAIIRHLIDVTPYSEYVLEVADTNTAAVKLYEKLDFAEFKRIKVKHSKRSGVNAYVYMKYSKK